MTEKIRPFLWYDDKAHEAAKFYCSIFENAKILNESEMGCTFELEGRQFVAFNGGPEFKFTEAISMFVNCETQREVDEYWERLSAGGRKSRCGWLQDKYGLWWQVVPSVLFELLGSDDEEKAERVQKAMLAMDKLDIEGLKRA
ncbi:MAG: VOC family protein [Candidatus Eremiobacteraeota bacterium]|nr:VOC family protein [Candidatus Eremiobacteraeota bacterium]MBV8223420.1 VOC family protein [Candidatus Eremiobacteraeota bacterium]